MGRDRGHQRVAQRRRNGLVGARGGASASRAAGAADDAVSTNALLQPGRVPRQPLERDRSPLLLRAAPMVVAAGGHRRGEVPGAPRAVGSGGLDRTPDYRERNLGTAEGLYTTAAGGSRD